MESSIIKHYSAVPYAPFNFNACGDAISSKCSLMVICVLIFLFFVGWCKLSSVGRIDANFPLMVEYVPSLLWLRDMCQFSSGCGKCANFLLIVVYVQWLHGPQNPK